MALAEATNITWAVGGTEFKKWVADTAKINGWLEDQYYFEELISVTESKGYKAYLVKALQFTTKGIEFAIRMCSIMSEQLEMKNMTPGDQEAVFLRLIRSCMDTWSFAISRKFRLLDNVGSGVGDKIGIADPATSRSSKHNYHSRHGIKGQEKPYIDAGNQDPSIKTA